MNDKSLVRYSFEEICQENGCKEKKAAEKVVFYGYCIELTANHCLLGRESLKQ